MLWNGDDSNDCISEGVTKWMCEPTGSLLLDVTEAKGSACSPVSLRSRPGEAEPGITDAVVQSIHQWRWLEAAISGSSEVRSGSTPPLFCYLFPYLKEEAHCLRPLLFFPECIVALWQLALQFQFCAKRRRSTMMFEIVSNTVVNAQVHGFSNHGIELARRTVDVHRYRCRTTGILVTTSVQSHSD